MRNFLKARFTIIVYPMIIALALFAAACGTAAPQELEIPVKLTGGQLDPGTIKVGQNDTVTLKIESDQPGSIHLHGYDLEQEVNSGEITDFVFVADASGRFRIAFHAAENDPEPHEDDGHGEIFLSEVMEPGQMFSLSITKDMAGKVISYHSHLHPEVIGSVQVSADAPAADTVQVEIRGDETDLPVVMVRPGTTIMWTNNSSEIQMLSSGDHVEIMEDTHLDASHGHEEVAEEEEVDIGFLEVQPR